MHPIDKKSKIYSVVTLLIATAVSLYFVLQNPYYLIVFPVFALFAVSKPIEIKPKLVLIGLLIMFTFPSLYLAEYLLAKNGTLPTEKYEQFTTSALYVSLILVVPLFALSIYFVQLVQTAEFEKDNYELIQNYPDLICSEHFTRTKKYTIFGFKGVKCRVGKKCMIKGHIKKASNLVGLIGKVDEDKIVNGKFYTVLWDHFQNKIRSCDFDIIEIHENDEVKDYDYIISKITTFFSNDINRFKPINKVLVQIIGNPAISENSKRILEKYFLEVKYFQEA